MKLIKPSYKILTKIDGAAMLRAIEEAGRTCYKSEDKIAEESAEDFIAGLIRKGHHSVIEHQFFTVRFVCDRGVSHEIVRHRLASFSQESTRYCNYSKDKFDNQLTFIIPLWVDLGPMECKIDLLDLSDPEELPFVAPRDYPWFVSMVKAEQTYNQLINIGWKPQEARAVLPNSLKTEIVVTANLREWRTIFTQRTSPAAHPQMRELMIPLWNEIKEKIPVVFDEI